MDVCVVLYRCDAARVLPGLREHDHLWTRDNTHDNIGFGAAANELALAGDDPLVCFVNPDGDLTRECLDELERAMADPAIVACEPDLGIWNRDPLPGGDMDWLSGACLVVRRRSFRDVGGFDGRLFMYGEDVDLSYKLAPFGRLAHVSTAHFSHPAGGRSYRARHRAFRNHLVVQQRHRHADPGRMLRDAAHSMRSRELSNGVARITGLVDYFVRARHWA